MRAITSISATAVVLLCAAYVARAEQTPLSGRPGSTPKWNVSFLDLSSPKNFKAGQHLEVHFVGGTMKTVVGRLVPSNCANDDPCQIIDNCKHFPVANGVATLILDRDYADIRQISVHSGISGRAWDCEIDGGPMPQIARVYLVQ